MNAVAAAGVQAQIEKAVRILKDGGIVVYPTDTVYGLGASMNSVRAVERIFEVKGRQKEMALPLLVADRDMVKSVAGTVPPAAWLLMFNFMPGALTLVLPKSAAVPDAVTGGAATVAVRIPDHPAPLALIQGLGAPIVGTSANRSGQPSALTAAEAQAQIGEGVDMIIDGGRCPGGIESTVVDLSGKKPVVLREGAISLAALRRTCPDIERARESGNAHRRR